MDSHVAYNMGTCTDKLSFKTVFELNIFKDLQYIVFIESGFKSHSVKLQVSYVNNQLFLQKRGLKEIKSFVII